MYLIKKTLNLVLRSKYLSLNKKGTLIYVFNDRICLKIKNKTCFSFSTRGAANFKN
jgi:hypothetical protein